MNKFWLILVALWRIAIWKIAKDAEVQVKRQELKDAVKTAIEKDDTRALHRIMSGL